MGGIQCIFDASIRVQNQNDLWYIVYYIFTKFTTCGGNSGSQDSRTVYLQPKSLPSLAEIAKTKYMETLLRNQVLDLRNPKTNNLDLVAFSNILNTILEGAGISHSTKKEIQDSPPCNRCFRPCFDSHIRVYEISPSINRTSKMSSCCSLNCAMQEDKFSKSKLYLYSSNEINN